MKNKNLLSRIAAILTIVIGLMAVFAGSKVLLGIMPDYYVIDWLPVYNFAMGVVSVLFCSTVIWKNNRLAILAAAAMLGLHTLVMVILQAVYRDVVAMDSIVAMTVRLIVWTIILGLLITQRQINNRYAGGCATRNLPSSGQ